MMKLFKKPSIHGKDEALFRGPATPGTSGGRPRAPPENLKTPTTPNEEARVPGIAKKAGLMLLVCVFAMGGALIGSYIGSVWDKAGGQRARQYRRAASPPPPATQHQRPDFSSSGPAAEEAQQEGFTSGLTSSSDSLPAGAPDGEGLYVDHIGKDVDSMKKEWLGHTTDLLEKEAIEEEGLPDYDALDAEEGIEKDTPPEEEETLADDINASPEEAEDLEKDGSVEEHKRLGTGLLEEEALEGEGLPDYDAPETEVLEDDSRQEESLSDDDAPRIEDLFWGEAPVEEIAMPAEQKAPGNSHPEHPSSSRYWALLEHQENSRRFSQARAALKQHRFEEAHELLVGMAGLDASIREMHQWAPAGNFHSGEFHADLGITLASADRFQEAMPLLAKGLRGAPKAFCLNALGVAYRNLGDPQSALEALRTAVQLAPKNPKAWTNFGVLALELGDLQQADDAFYYAAEALGPKASEDGFLVQNVQALQNRARGLPAGEPGALELWYENDDEPGA